MESAIISTKYQVVIPKKVREELGIQPGQRVRVILYRGRIDNRYVELGRYRPEASVHDLHDALSAVVAGREVERPETIAIGCFLPELP